MSAFAEKFLIFDRDSTTQNGKLSGVVQRNGYDMYDIEKYLTSAECKRTYGPCNLKKGKWTGFVIKPLYRSESGTDRTETTVTIEGVRSLAKKLSNNQSDNIFGIQRRSSPRNNTNIINPPYRESIEYNNQTLYTIKECERVIRELEEENRGQSLTISQLNEELDNIRRNPITNPSNATGYSKEENTYIRLIRTNTKFKEHIDDIISMN